MTESQIDEPTRWERRKESTYRRLLMVGEELFRTQGFDATTVEEIAVAADVAKGTFFNYFTSKEKLLGELLYLRTEPLLASPPGDQASAVERIWLLLQDVRRELLPYAHLFQRMLAYAMSHPKPEPPPESHRTLGQAVAHLVREGQRQGSFRVEGDPDVAGALIATYFFRLLLLECVCDSIGKFCWADQMRAGLDLVYNGLIVDKKES